MARDDAPGNTSFHFRYKGTNLPRWMKGRCRELKILSIAVMIEVKDCYPYVLIPSPYTSHIPPLLGLHSQQYRIVTDQRKNKNLNMKGLIRLINQ